MRFRYLLLAPLVFAWTSVHAGQNVKLRIKLLPTGVLEGIPKELGTWKLDVEFASDPSTNYGAPIKKLSLVRNGVALTLPSAATQILPSNSLKQIHITGNCFIDKDSSHCSMTVYFSDPEFKSGWSDGPGAPDYLMVFNLFTGKLKEMFFMSVRDHGRSIRPIPINLKMWCSPSEIESVLDPEAVK